MFYPRYLNLVGRDSLCMFPTHSPSLSYFQGRLLARDIVSFAKDGASATQFQILTPKEFPDILSDGSLWFVDFYAPWCPPCMRLLPEFRKASRLIEDSNVKFGKKDSFYYWLLKCLMIFNCFLSCTYQFLLQ